MKAAIVLGAGQTPVYGDFNEPLPSSGESRVTVTAAAISHVVRSRASGAHYSSSGQFPFVVGTDGVGRLDEKPGLFRPTESASRRHGGANRRVFGAVPGAA